MNESQGDRVFRFLVTTDNHLGYKHTDHIRGEDSFSSFAEALEIGRNHDVDFILLGGDLFHTNRPTAMVEHRCIQIIRQHMTAQCSRPTSFRRLAGRFCHFEKVSHPNFEDPHLTVPYPILTIHGNHDDQTGPQNQSVCAKLATSGLLNYFGLATSSKSEITVEPIILEKGGIKIALYGMGFIPDHTLRHAFEKGLVTFKRAPEDCFNVLVVHQNRELYIEGKCIPDELYPKFIHLLIRGHEHRTLAPEPLLHSEVNGTVYQPGSTVATSISIKEVPPKKVCVFEVRIADPNGNPATKFRLDHKLIELESFRALLFKDIPQKDIFRYIKSQCSARALRPAEYIAKSQAYVEECIKEMLRNYNPQLSTDDGPQAPKKMRHNVKPILPIVRVRLEFANKLEKFDDLEVSRQFYPNTVANPDIILFKKQKLLEKEDGTLENVTFTHDDQGVEDSEDPIDFVDLSAEKRDTIESALEKYFVGKPDSEKLQVLSLSEYIDAIRSSHEEGNVISKVVKTKKQEVLHMYWAELKDESTARTRFHSETDVEKWMLSAFGSNPPKTGGDEIEVFTID